MKKHWLRGILLGVSLALLLAGGVALANGMWLSVDRTCAVCVTREEALDPAPVQIVTLTAGGWSAGDYTCVDWTINGQTYIDHECSTQTTAGPVETVLRAPCDLPLPGPDELGTSFLQGEASAAVIESALGVHVIRLSLEEPPGTEVDSAEVSILFVRDISECPGEFVPEPASILLLGSGLAGLAGYATLRWRTRQ